MTAAVRTTSEFVFISTRWGEPNDYYVERNLLTPEDHAALQRLVPKMTQEITFVVRDRNGQYGIAFETHELSFDECDDSDRFTKEAWNGQSIGDKKFDGTNMPTLEEALAHMESTYLAPLRERYPDIDWHASVGPHTIMGRLTMLGFVPETSPRIDELEEIALVVIYGDKVPSPSP